VKSGASVGGDDADVAAESTEPERRLRLFVGLPLPEDAVERLAAWQRDVLAPRGRGRLVPPENLHATVAFLGSRPAGEAGAIGASLRAAAAGCERPVFASDRYRETRSVGMVVLTDEEGRGAALAERVWERLEELGVYRREARPWLPHVTVLRLGRAEEPARRSGSGPAPPDLGRVSPSDLALYTSVLRPGGAQYAQLELVALGG
jgi:2'-5' RNA ligase